MATIYISFLLTFVVLSVSVYVMSLWYRKTKSEKAHLPPGQKGLPFIGETLDFFRCGQEGNPEKFITDRMGKFSDKVFRTSLLGENVVVMCGAAGNKMVLTGDNNYITPWIPESQKQLLLSPEHNQMGTRNAITGLRKIVNEFLKPEFLRKKLVSVMDQMSEQHILQEWVGKQQVLVFDLAKKYTFSLACHLFLSLNDPERIAYFGSLLLSIITGITSMPINLPGTAFYAAIKSRRLLRREIMSIIKQRQLDLMSKNRSNMESTSSKDMLSHILLSTYAQDGKFPNDMIIADIILGLLIAGNESVSSAITFMVKFLADLPHVYAQVLEEQMEIARAKMGGESLNWEDLKKMKYTWCVALETMRLTPPAQGTFREFTTDFTYAGFTIPKGWKAYWTVHSTNKNPEYFPNPEVFDPMRSKNGGPSPFSFVPFGAGNHICPGIEYAKVEILVFIHQLVTRFHFETLLPNEKIRYIIGAVPANGMPIRLHPRNPQTI